MIESNTKISFAIFIIVLCSTSVRPAMRQPESVLERASLLAESVILPREYALDEFNFLVSQITQNNNNEQNVILYLLNLYKTNKEFFSELCNVEIVSDHTNCQFPIPIVEHLGTLIKFIAHTRNIINAFHKTDSQSCLRKPPLAMQIATVLLHVLVVSTRKFSLSRVFNETVQTKMDVGLVNTFFSEIHRDSNFEIFIQAVYQTANSILPHIHPFTALDALGKLYRRKRVSL